jgi:integrase/recombinase XerC
MPSDCAICPTEIWLATLRSQGRSPVTIRSYRRALDQLRAWRSDPDLTTLTRLEAMAFASHLATHHNPGGVALCVRSLRPGWSWMLQEGLIESNPWARMRISVPEKAQSTATPAEITAMLDSAKRCRSRLGARDLALLSVLADTGCRRGEIANVEWGDIDVRSGMITFRISKTTARTVPLSERAIGALSRWLRYRGTGPGSLWSVTDPYSLVNAACLRHSGGKLRPHALRRAFACTWLERGGIEIGLMRAAGWKSLAMIKTYTRARADVLAADEMRRLMG